MKRLFMAFLLFTMLLGVTGCSNTELKEADPLVLEGTWVYDGDISHKAVITDETIEIYWVSEDSKSLYWAGSFTAPENLTVEDEYKWISNNDFEKTNKALLASSDDTKEFTYSDGIISYEASAMGTTTNVKLTKTE